MRRVFVCSPYAGDFRRNEIVAEAVCAVVTAHGDAPYAPHLHNTRFLPEDGGPGREIGINVGLAFLRVCDMLAWYSLDGKQTPGMRQEVQQALEWGMPVIDMCKADVVNQEVQRRLEALG